MWTISELKSRAKVAFKSNYWLCVAASFIIGLLAGGSGGSAGRSVGNKSDELSSTLDNMSTEQILVVIAAILAVVAVVMIIAFAWKTFAANLFEIGGARFFTVNAEVPAELGEIVYGFKSSYGSNCLAMFMRDLFIWLWSLLLIIPGIIKHYEYYMVPYILADNPGISWKDALAESKEMMRGNKWNTFVLELSFIGWYLLSILTLGILVIFYVGPYIRATKAELYRELRG